MASRRAAIDRLGALLLVVCALESQDPRPSRLAIRIKRVGCKLDTTLESRTTPSKLESRGAALLARLRSLLDEIPDHCARKGVDESNRTAISEACRAIVARVQTDVDAAVKAAKLVRQPPKLVAKPNGQPTASTLSPVSTQPLAPKRPPPIAPKKRKPSEPVAAPLKRARTDSLSRPAVTAEQRQPPAIPLPTNGHFAGRPPVDPAKLKALTDAELLRTLALHPERVLRPGQTVLGVVDQVLHEAANVDPTTLSLRDWPMTKRRLWAMAESVMPERGPLYAARVTVQERFAEEGGQPQTDLIALIGLLAQLCAPARDHEVAKITHLLVSNQLEASLQLAVVLLASMRTDLLQFQAQAITKGGQMSIEDIVRSTAQQRERVAIMNIWGAQPHLLARLGQWIARHGGGDLLHALIESLLSSKPPVMPAMSGVDGEDALPALLCLAAQEIFGLQNFIQAILILASLHAASGSKATTDLNRLWDLLQSEIQRSVHNPSRTSAEHLAAELGLEVNAVTQILRGYDDPIYRLLATRLKQGLEQFVRNDQSSVVAAPPTMQTGNRASLATPPPTTMPVLRIPGLLDDAIADKISQAAIGIRELFRWTAETWLSSP